MKKISIFILLAVIPLSPAEMQRPKPSSAKASSFAKASSYAEATKDRSEDKTEGRQSVKKKPEQKPEPKPVLFATNPYAISTQHHPQHSTQLICPSDFPPINNIIQASYHGIQQNHTTTTSTDLLTPVYKHTNKPIEQEEKKSLLRTNSLRPDENVMESLYRKSSRIISLALCKPVGQKYHSKKLVSLINYMNQEKNNGIHEDVMGRFVYNNKKGKYIISNGYTDIDIVSLDSLVFSLLKTYNLTIHETGEQLPLHLKTKKVHLKDAFNNNITSDITNIYTDFKTYPAFFQLLHAIQYAAQALPLDSVNIFTEYLYGNKNSLLQNYSQGSYTDSNLKNEFYAHAYNLLLQNGTTHDLYHLMQMIDKAKNMKDIKNEDDLAIGILGFEPNHPFTAFLLSLADNSHTVENVKKRIALFCILAKEYNKTRLPHQITPTAAQYYAYTVKKSLDIFLSDNSLFDEKYAFASFEQLLKGTELLQETDQEEIDEEFNKYYPQYK